MRNVFIVFTLALIIVSSCITGDPNTTVETIVINESGVDVEYVTYGYLYHQSIDTIEIINDGNYITTGSDVGGYPIFPSGADSIKIIFEGGVSITYSPFLEENNKERNPFSIETYDEKRISKYHYQYTYFITEEDYNSATPIN